MTTRRRTYPRQCDMTRAVLREYRRADPWTLHLGADWYPGARRACSGMAQSFGVSLETVAGIMAALSPRRRWSDNVTATYRILAGERVGGLSDGIGKAYAILACDDVAEYGPLDILSGPKVRAFYRAIVGDDTGDAVIDVWAIRACTRGRYDSVAPAWYARASAAYHSAARILGVNVHAVQATVWTVYRGSAA